MDGGGWVPVFSPSFSASLLLLPSCSLFHSEGMQSFTEPLGTRRCFLNTHNPLLPAGSFGWSGARTQVIEHRAGGDRGVRKKWERRGHWVDSRLCV